MKDINAIPEPLKKGSRGSLVAIPVVGAIGITFLGIALSIWKANWSRHDWLSANGATLLGSIGTAAALFFVAAGAIAQARQVQSTELLSAFELARADLEDLSKRIASNARVVVRVRKDGRPGRYLKRLREYERGDRTAFARLFAHGTRIKGALGPQSALTQDSKDNLARQVRLYIQIFERIVALAPSAQLRGFLLELPLGRAYCALKVASDQDDRGEFIAFLRTIEPVADADVDDEAGEDE